MGLSARRAGLFQGSETVTVLVRFSAEDAFEENTLSIYQATAQDLNVCITISPPTIRINRSTYQLLYEPAGGIGAEPGLCVHMPIKRGIDVLNNMPDGDFGSADYVTGRRTPASAATNLALLAAAGISSENMTAWTQSHAMPCGRSPVWLLAALSHLRSLRQAPTRDIFVRGDSESNERPIHQIGDGVTSSLFREFECPKAHVWVYAPGIPHAVVAVVASADPLANRPMISLSCAVAHGVDAAALEHLQGTGVIRELFKTEGGALRRSLEPHLTKYRVLGEVDLRLNLQPAHLPPIWIPTRMLVYEDRSLGRNTCIDMVLDMSLINLLPPQRRGI
ncbi:hypothetical protein T484DRAFT_1756382 [Baffinella frigidus]|nr:hypothetical protein T484DRAFT_1756382 [Cryptophyta sp. CCMP2293]